MYDRLRMRQLRLLPLVALVALCTAPSISSQSELVIVKEGAKLYHRPGCPIVRDGAGVTAMTRAQAESRQYKAHPDCDPDNPKAPAPKAAPPPPVTVYVDGSKYYHRKECAKATKPSAVKAVSLEEAGKTLWPCPDCKPPVRRRSTESAIPGMRRRGG
jgi:hypothetical protein